jgi:hypothetical protein
VRWWPVATVVFLAVVLILVGISLASEPDDSLEAGAADSLDAESPDSLAGAADSLSGEDLGGHDEEEEAEAGEAARARRGKPLSQAPRSWLWDTHPKYDVSISRRKDVTNWDTKIALQRRLSEKLSLNLNASLHTRENSTLNRSDSNDQTSGNLKYKLNDAIDFGLSYSSSINANRFGLGGAEPKDRKKKQDLTVSSEFSKAISDAVTVTVKTVAGSTENSYADVRNKGSKQDISASVSYSPMHNLETSVKYSGRRMLLDSAIDSSGVSVFTSADRTLSQNLSLDMSYDVIPGIKVDFDVARSNQEKQHPEPKEKKQETETSSTRTAGVKSSFALIEWLTWDMSVDFRNSSREFKLQTDKNNRTENSSLAASAKLRAWRGARFNLGGGREITRSEYTTANSGDDVHSSLSLKLSQDLGQKADLNVTALSDMVSVFYDDKIATPKDRDRLSNRLSMDLDYNPQDKISTRLGGEYSEEQSVYVEAAASANNSTTRKYKVSGSYAVKTIRNVNITQTYDLSAVYTYYHYNESNNTLVRSSNVQTRFGIPIFRSLTADFNHHYKFQDQGSYIDEGGRRSYGKSSETESHVLSLGCNYKIGNLLKIAVNQSYSVQRSWDYHEGEKTLGYERVTADISGKMVFKYDLGDKTKVSLSIQQNRKEGSTVNEAFKSYRNIELEASHVF